MRGYMLRNYSMQRNLKKELGQKLDNLNTENKWHAARLFAAPMFLIALFNKEKIAGYLVGYSLIEKYKDSFILQSINEHWGAILVISYSVSLLVSFSFIRKNLYIGITNVRDFFHDHLPFLSYIPFCTKSVDKEVVKLSKDFIDNSVASKALLLKNILLETDNNNLAFYLFTTKEDIASTVESVRDFSLSTKNISEEEKTLDEVRIAMEEHKHAVESLFSIKKYLNTNAPKMETITNHIFLYLNETSK